MRRCRPLLGTFVEVVCNVEEAIEPAFEALARVHRLMSAHEPDSDLSRINRNAAARPVRVHRWTAGVIRSATEWARLSGGAFDIVSAGGEALRRGDIPLHDDQPWPAASADWTAIEMRGDVVTLSHPSCLDLGGIAKGFAVDRAVEAMIAAGASGGLVNAGGDLRGFGAEPWPASVVDPVDRRPLIELEVRDFAVATSAGLAAEEGLDFGHLPGAGGRWISVTVRAARACDADALTKIVLAGGPEAPHCLAAAGATALRIARDGIVEPLAPAPEENA